MHDKHDIWLKAAVVGSLWGASEIVLGSFLHNLRIPFSGNLLTAIGIILMVSGYRTWPEKGLVWRAGLICAALKTLSPSPVILGPMLSIFMQATLMEAAIRAGRGTWAGMLAGGGLAMSWNLLYRILSTLLIYGNPVVDLYQQLVSYLFRQTGLQFTGYWTPILVLGGLFFSFGMVAGAAGIQVSRAARKRDGMPSWQPVFRRKGQPVPFHDRGPAEKTWSPLQPFAFLALLAAGLHAMAVLSLPLSMALLSAFLLLAWWHDRRLVGRFAGKKGFWLGMAVMVLLSGLLLGPPGSDRVLDPGGLRIGAEMCMRAIYVITGFGIISKELKHPGIMRWVKRRHLEPFLLAVRIAFQATPSMIEAIPGRQAWRNPGRVLTGMVKSMEFSLEAIRNGNRGFGRVFIITGARGAGKTTLAAEVVRGLKKQGAAFSGILAPEILVDGLRDGYLVEDLGRGSRKVLCRRKADPDPSLPGAFVFDPEGIRFGEEALAPPLSPNAHLVIVDELGPYELKGMGWARAMDRLMEAHEGDMLWVVRPSLVHKMLERWPAANSRVFWAGKDPAGEVLEAMGLEANTNAHHEQ
jgi:nucleoside-triphosphatase THEP1